MLLEEGRKEEGRLPTASAPGRTRGGRRPLATPHSKPKSCTKGEKGGGRRGGRRKRAEEEEEEEEEEGRVRKQRDNEKKEVKQ
jgi:hypothetical protein